MVFWVLDLLRLSYSTAPPEHSLSRCSETAGEVWKDLGFGV